VFGVNFRVTNRTEYGPNVIILRITAAFRTCPYRPNVAGERYAPESCAPTAVFRTLRGEITVLLERNTNIPIVDGN